MYIYILIYFNIHVHGLLLLCFIFRFKLRNKINLKINMGYDLQRFQSDVDEELTCPICSGVLEDPVQV